MAFQQAALDTPGHRLWDLLQPFQTRLATLNVFIVRYPAPVEYPIPLVSLILNFDERLPDRETFRASVLRGAETLAASAGQ